MHVENARYMNPLTRSFFTACEQAGLPGNDDFNDWSHPQDGFGRFQVWRVRAARCLLCAVRVLLVENDFAGNVYRFFVVS